MFNFLVTADCLAMPSNLRALENVGEGENRGILYLLAPFDHISDFCCRRVGYLVDRCLMAELR
jgi:hypothetical protein